MIPCFDYSRIIMCKGSPLAGATSNGVRTLLEQEHSEKMLAAALEKELVTRISNILICENPEKGIPKNTGYHFIIQPFMERKGYRDSGGWWIKEAVVVDEFHFDKYTILALDQDIPMTEHDAYIIGSISYKPEYLHIRPNTNEPIRNHIAIESAGSFLGKTVRFEMKHATQPEVENDE